MAMGNGDSMQKHPGPGSEAQHEPGVLEGGALLTQKIVELFFPNFFFDKIFFFLIILESSETYAKNNSSPPPPP